MKDDLPISRYPFESITPVQNQEVGIVCESRKKTVDMTRARAGARGRLGMLSVPKPRAPPGAPIIDDALMTL